MGLPEAKMTIDDMIQAKKQQLSEEKVLVSLEQLREQASELERLPLSLAGALSGDGLALIGPIMKASPYTKTSRNKCDAPHLARMEQRLGVRALMVATEQTFFQGQQEFVGGIRDFAQVPILLYDCIIEEYQIYAAVCLGADAVVLMSAVLDLEMLQRLASLTRELGMEPVVEVHTEKQMQTALQSGVETVLINNLALDGTGSLDVSHQLGPMVPEGNISVSWGGIGSLDDLETLRQWGLSAACPEFSLLCASTRKELQEADGSARR